MVYMFKLNSFYIIYSIMGLNHNVWLPHLKFTLQTIAITYPSHPNDVSKKKYYDFIQNLPVFFPLEPFGKNFLKLLDKYPVTPYLSSRMSFMKWIHFILNKIHEQLEQPVDDFYDSLEKYYDEYKPKEIRNKELIKTRQRYIQFGIALLIIGGIFYIYKK
tara:strand:- start:55 stop:534 length:480 start_codon:yes stop_codon:yes gene_type:complete